MINSK
jgi:hypothetical protein